MDNDVKYPTKGRNGNLNAIGQSYQILTKRSFTQYIIGPIFRNARRRIRAAHGPENINRLRRFAISIVELTEECSGVREKWNRFPENTASSTYDQYRKSRPST